MKTKESALWKKSVQVGSHSFQVYYSECYLLNIPHFLTAVVTWDREVYILNNGTLPTVCGLLRSKPTGRNVTVNVSFEAGDMAGWCSFVMYCFIDYHCIGLGICNRLSLHRSGYMQ